MGICKKFMASPSGAFLYAVITGVIGIFILLSFLSMILPPHQTALILPAIVAFNGAASGFGLAERYTAERSSKGVLLFVIGLVITITGPVALHVLFPWEPMFTIARYLYCGIAALAAVFFGAWLSRRKDQAKGKDNHASSGEGGSSEK